MMKAAAKGRALMGGTTAMREARETYLPRFAAESIEAYDARLKSSWLFNGYRKAVRDYTGKVFAKPVEVGDGVPDAMQEWLMNADLQGNDLSVFARQVFEDGIGPSGVAFVMVDAPPRNGDVTRAAAAAENLRPYLVHLRVEDVLGWKTQLVGNRLVLGQIRIMETVREDDPRDEFSQVTVEQVRVLDRVPGGVQTRIYRKGDGINKERWSEVEEMASLSPIPEITVAPFYANRTGFFTGAPLLDDLADVNIAHWQSQSDQRNILHYARVPILFASGRTEDEAPIEISAARAVVSADPSASLTWVEHSGAAIGAGRQDLKDLEFQMEAHGLQLLVARPGQQSATGEALDAEKETSTLAMTADALKDCLEQALTWMAAYGGFGEIEPDVMVNTEFGATMMTAQEMTVLLSAVNTGQLSRETFIREMARRGMIGAEIEPADEAERIADEGLTLGAE